ncbi:ferredoxin--NADP reductase [Mucilaginibacter segetis]|uniref:Ferredoxin--NADP reductase n=1 Tax=Mucilaginibacter segetis TaxID=2793071 RepID=A0A934PUH4_9SPHI|nr:ferredoxin--NADP reductase [Mucilaginibacter segetis]MBK0379772.1 ferredoxin--NADP reductase [Mucilaginibacter segetis]
MIDLRVDTIKWELPDTATFYFTTTIGKEVSYKAGQFITLVFQHHGEEIRRSYSLSSSPDEGFLSITVKRIANGEISRFLLNKIKPGDILTAIEPAGRFMVTDSQAEKDIVFFAAGSGIAPVLSQLKYILKRPGKSRIHLIYSNKKDASILFAHELNELETVCRNRLNVVHLLSSEARRLNNVMVEQLVNEQLHFGGDKAEFYLCGPFAYMRMINLTLLYMGIDARQIRKENFVLETVPVTATQITYPPKNIRIKFNGEWHDVTAGENQSILQAALQNNIALPYSCRNGICSACTALCKSGKVEMAKNEVLTNEDIANGLVLTCTAHALTDDVEIEYQPKLL